ncbi:SpoIIE family protein phosphatase [soil metagenome]
MALSIELSTAKTNKYASRESGDTVEFVERPTGGFSAVLVDGQGSGAAAKSLSLQVTSQAVSLLKNGVRDGVVARAVHDSLFAFRGGRVSATVDILSADLKTRQIVVTRNAGTPLVVVDETGVQTLQVESGAVGLFHFTRPTVLQFPMSAGLSVISMSDGIYGAGNRVRTGTFDVGAWLADQDHHRSTADELATLILNEAVARDQGRPLDDMSVVVMSIRKHSEQTIVRRIDMRIPLP